MKLRLHQLEQSSIRDTRIVFSSYRQAQPFKIPALFSIPQLVETLSFSALNYHLFQKNCCPSPACALCDASIEDAKHYFLYCPSFAALRENPLLTSAERLLGNRWHITFFLLFFLFILSLFYVCVFDLDLLLYF